MGKNCETIKDIVRKTITEDILIEHYHAIANGARFISKWRMKEIKNTIIVYWHYDDINGVMCTDSRANAAKIRYTAYIYGDMEDITVCDSIEITDFEEKGTGKLFAELNELFEVSDHDAD